MPLTAAEKQRRYRERQRSNPLRYDKYLRKEQKRWKERKASGKIKLILDMTPRDQRQQRRKWKSQKEESEEHNVEQGETTKRSKSRERLRYKLKLANKQLEIYKREASKFKKRWL